MNLKHERLNEEDESYTNPPPAPAPGFEEANAGAERQVPQATSYQPVQAVPERQIPQVTPYQPVQAVPMPGDQPAHNQVQYPGIIPNSPQQAVPQRAMPYHVQQSYPVAMRPQGIPVNQMIGRPSRIYWYWDIHFKKGCFCMQLRHTLSAFFIISMIFHLAETIAFFSTQHFFFGVVMTIMLLVDLTCIWCCFRQRVEPAKLVVWLIAVNFFFALLDLILSFHEAALFAMLLNFYMLALAFSEVNRLLNLQAGLNPYPQAQIIINQPPQFQQVPQNPPN